MTVFSSNSSLKFLIKLTVMNQHAKNSIYKNHPTSQAVTQQGLKRELSKGITAYQ